MRLLETKQRTWDEVAENNITRMVMFRTFCLSCLWVLEQSGGCRREGGGGKIWLGQQHFDRKTSMGRTTTWDLGVYGAKQMYLRDNYLEETKQTKNKLHGLSPRANYTDRATAAYRRSDWQLCA
jgi:hypothetical protein